MVKTKVYFFQEMIQQNVTNVPLTVLLYIELTVKVKVHNTLVPLLNSILTGAHVLIFYKTILFFPTKMCTFSSGTFSFCTVVLLSEGITSALSAWIILSYIQNSVFQLRFFCATLRTDCMWWVHANVQPFSWVLVDSADPTCTSVHKIPVMNKVGKNT